jgi:hypothetical protein
VCRDASIVKRPAAECRRHRVDFIDMVQIFDGRPTFTYRSPRNDENRWVPSGS